MLYVQGRCTFRPRFSVSIVQNGCFTHAPSCLSNYPIRRFLEPRSLDVDPFHGPRTCLAHASHLPRTCLAKASRVIPGFSPCPATSHLIIHWKSVHCLLDVHRPVSRGVRLTLTNPSCSGVLDVRSSNIKPLSHVLHVISGLSYGC